MFTFLLVQFEERDFFDLSVRKRYRESVTEFTQRLQSHFLLLMGYHLTFTRFTHPVAFDRLCKNDGWLASVFRGGGVGCVHFVGIVTASPQRPDFVVAHFLHELRGLGIFVEELLAYIGAVL